MTMPGIMSDSDDCSVVDASDIESEVDPESELDSQANEFAQQYGQMERAFQQASAGQG